jgi:ankyrin repeat protein
MLRAGTTAIVGLLLFLAAAAGQESHSVEYDVARTHELKPHRRTIPTAGVSHGFNQLKLTLQVNETGDVMHADASGSSENMKLWPSLQTEVAQWKFRPFEEAGKPVAAEVEEYIDLVTPELLPTKHVLPPALRADSDIEITLERTGCYGSCPGYKVTLSRKGIVFEGRGYTVAEGTHTAPLEMDAIRSLAQRIIAADFYSFKDEYRAGVTDSPTYELSVSIDGRQKHVEDYVGQWVGMPAVVHDLEDAVDEVAHSDRWISGAPGLVDALRAESYHFKTFEAQVMLKNAIENGQTQTVKELLTADVPLKLIPAPKQKEPYIGIPYDHQGWLAVAASHPEILQILIDAEASKNDQEDKNLALLGAARTGNVKSFRALVNYGANPHADLNVLTVTERGAGMTMQSPGSGTYLIYAASSGNPDMVREVLQYNPYLEARDGQGKTALIAAGDYRYSVSESARAECVRLLVNAGANVNGTDGNGNTALHETFLTEVEKELLALGANVNARNNNGETPIFTTYDNDAIPLFITHGADLTIRNKDGKTVFEAATSPVKQDALRKAVAERKSR